MQANPILAELTRGNWIENRHRGAFVVTDAFGTIIAQGGDIARPVFPRSAIKSMQAMAMFTSGAMKKFELSSEELALACASHRGEDVHISGVTEFLEHIGLAGTDLECGAHSPTSREAREELRAKNEKPTQLHNNCSGKHSGMLSVALALGVDPHGYVERDHPVQIEVRRAIEIAIGTELSLDRCGRDGCSIPTWAAPLESWAKGFARMASGQGLAPDFAAAAHHIFDAATAHPGLVAGTDQLDTLVMDVFGGRVMQKGGAEGVQCGAVRNKGWGYALKCDDGNMAASQVMVANLLLAIADPDPAQAKILDRFANQNIKNVRGFDVGLLAGSAEMRAVKPGAFPG